MPVAQRGQPETLVVPGVGGIADADHRVVEQPDDRGDDTLERQATTAQIAVDPVPQVRQALGESDKARIFGTIALFGPLRMIAILLASALVPAGCLDMAV